MTVPRGLVGPSPLSSISELEVETDADGSVVEAIIEQPFLDVCRGSLCRIFIFRVRNRSYARADGHFWAYPVFQVIAAD